MDNEPIAPLLPLFERERAAGNALVLGVLLHTAGSTYRKPGALILLASNGEYAGLLSGGCLEGDLAEHARAVIGSGVPRMVSYDTRGPDDLLWGLGIGCEGAMQILLLRMDAQRDWQPLTHLALALANHERTAVGIIAESASADLPVGSIALPDNAQDPLVRAALQKAAASVEVGWLETPGGKLFLLPLWLPPRLLLLGAGPDVLPVLDFASRLGWKVTLVDHRDAYAQTSRFPAAEAVVLCRPDGVERAIALSGFSAAVVMSHHLPSDLAYLRALAASDIPYVGLLGPPARRERLLQELGSLTERLLPRLHAPVGLALGGRSPESLALAIVAEVHAFVHGVQKGR
jgi:xanthine/CO dehydrogenase XdhC/CoxF family maturation factor